MRFARTTILAGGAAMLLAGTAAYAADKLHTLNVSLPDGSVAQIEYSGDVAPKVSVVPATVPIAYADPFAELDRMAAYMEAQHAAMMRQMPDMQHHEANAVSLDPGKSTNLLWRFSDAGTFEFACLIPGHREAGMHGTVVVK